MIDFATRGALGALGECTDRIIQSLGPSSDAAILELLRRCGPSNRNPTTDQMVLDGILQSTSTPIAWSAGLFVASELTGVISAAPTTPAACIEATLFVDEGWRRQGIGSMLLKETMDWARRGEATTLRFVCDRTDWPMRHFAEKFGARLDLVFGQMVAEIALVRQ